MLILCSNVIYFYVFTIICCIYSICRRNPFLDTARKKHGFIFNRSTFIFFWLARNYSVKFIMWISLSLAIIQWIHSFFPFFPFSSFVVLFRAQLPFLNLLIQLAVSSIFVLVDFFLFSKREFNEFIYIMVSNPRN